MPVRIHTLFPPFCFCHLSIYCVTPLSQNGCCTSLIQKKIYSTDLPPKKPLCPCVSLLNAALKSGVVIYLCPSLDNLKQGDCKFKAIVDYRTKTCINRKKERKRGREDRMVSKENRTKSNGDPLSLS